MNDAPTVLVVEDDTAISTLVSHIVRRERFAVETVATGRDAMLRLAAQPYALIVLDLMLPGVSGRDVLDYIRAQTPSSLANVIVMTASPSRLVEVEHEVCAVLIKPFDIARLVELVRKCANALPPSGLA